MKEGLKVMTDKVTAVRAAVSVVTVCVGCVDAGSTQGKARGLREGRPCAALQRNCAELRPRVAPEVPRGFVITDKGSSTFFIFDMYRYVEVYRTSGVSSFDCHHNCRLRPVSIFFIMAM